MLILENQKVAILGASDDKDRYSYMALSLLKSLGHEPIPIHPRVKEIDGVLVYHDLESAPKAHTLTLYVNPELQNKMLNAILAYAPKRVIFNPGTENKLLKEKLEHQGIETVEACTLVMLKTNQF